MAIDQHMPRKLLTVGALSTCHFTFLKKQSSCRTMMRKNPGRVRCLLSRREPLR
jgi:hypothetical protein